MNDFDSTLAQRIESYVGLQCSLGYAFRKQAAILRAFRHHVAATSREGPLTQQMALEFVRSRDLTPNGRAVQYAVLRRFAEYLTVYDARTQRLDPRALPRSRAVPPRRILSDQEVCSLVAASERLSPLHPQRGRTLATLVGLLASTGLRSGEALRLDRADVDLTGGILHVRQSKFRKDRLVPVHDTTLAALCAYARGRDVVFPCPKCPAFFVSLRGSRLSATALYAAWQEACALARLNAQHRTEAVRPHDLRHRFAVTRLAMWHRQQVDVQGLLPVLATYLGHTRYSDTAYYVTGTAELLGLAAERAFGNGGAG
jgi:integrase